jgi:hypothetical protein
LAQFTRVPVSTDIPSAIRRASVLHDTINSKFDNARSLADGVLLEFGPSRPQDLALRDHIRKWQPQLRALFLMRVASLNYRLQLPGFELPESVLASLEAYDECSAQLLEEIADQMEGKTSQGKPADSVPLLQRIQQSCRVDESRLSLSEHGGTFVPLLGQIDGLTTRLANQIATELG